MSFLLKPPDLLLHNLKESLVNRANWRLHFSHLFWLWLFSVLVLNHRDLHSVSDSTLKQPLKLVRSVLHFTFLRVELASINLPGFTLDSLFLIVSELLAESLLEL